MLSIIQHFITNFYAFFYEQSPKYLELQDRVQHKKERAAVSTTSSHP